MDFFLALDEELIKKRKKNKMRARRNFSLSFSEAWDYNCCLPPLFPYLSLYHSWTLPLSLCLSNWRSAIFLFLHRLLFLTSVSPCLVHRLPCLRLPFPVAIYLPVFDLSLSIYLWSISSYMMYQCSYLELLISVFQSLSDICCLPYLLRSLVSLSL